MREVKDSGIAWVGTMPTNWDVKRGKFTLRLLNRPLEETDEVITCFRDGEVTLRRNRREDGFTVSLKEIGYQGIEPGDLVIHGMDGFAGAIGISDSRGKSSPVLVVCDSSENKKYIMYYLRSMAYNDVFTALATGIRVRSCDLRWNKLAELPFILPSPDEQDKIVEAIEINIRKINTLIANVQAQIEKLKAYKQCMITEVVTKGIDPTAPMKDSGVEWLGKYPSHWGYMPFGYVLKERNEKNNPVVSEERLSLSIELGVTLYAEKTTNLDRFKDDFSQYKLAHAGDLVMNSMNMIVGATGVSPYFGCVSPAYYTFFDETDDHITAKYCEYVFRSKTMLRVLHSLGKGIYSIERGDDRINTCRLKVPKADLKALHIPVPPLDEQRRIVQYMNDKCAQISHLISIKQAKIEKLEQYKRSLIYEYVTGKKEVPEHI